jgi:hypothetical protein
LAVNARLAAQTRPREDLDTAIQRTDVGKLREVLGAEGYRQIKEDEWNSVSGDEPSHEIEIHAFRL